MSNSGSKDLELVREFLNEYKFEEALKLVNRMEQMRNLDPEDYLTIQAYKGNIYFLLGKLENAFEIGKDLYQKSLKMNMPLFSLDGLYIQMWILFRKQRIKEFIKIIEQCEILFNSIPREDTTEFQEREALLLYIKGSRIFLQGKLDLALEYYHKSLLIFEKINPNSYLIPTLLWGIAYDYQEKGELKLALEYTKKALSLVPDGEYHGLITTRAAINRARGMIYYQKGDLDRALQYYKRCLQDYKKFDEFNWIGGAYLNIILVLLAKSDFDLAKNYLERLRLYNEKHEIKRGSLTYQLSDALILKSSSRMRDRVEAENKLIKIVKDNINIFISNIALINLCDWYFEEFRLSNQMEILEDIPPLIEHLQRNAKLQNSYSMLANVKLLQAKLAILQISMIEARKFLTEAQQIAAEHGLQLLANQISKEHDHLLEELRLWESFKKEQTSVADRLKLASVNGVIERLQGKSALEPLESSEQQPASLLILTKGGLLLFSYPFTDEWKQDQDLFGSLVSAFSAFSDEFFSEGLDRAKFGEETLLLKSVGLFSICYLFRGQTYFAKQKLEKFVEVIQNKPELWKTLEKLESFSQVADLKDLPHMETLIKDIFLS